PRSRAVAAGVSSLPQAGVVVSIDLPARSDVMAKREIGFALAFLMLLTVTPAAQAQFAVIDVASLAQLMSQVRTLEQPAATGRNANPRRCCKPSRARLSSTPAAASRPSSS